MISESGMTENLVQSYWCTCRPVYGCSFSITSLDIYHSIYTCLIKLSDHKRLTYQFRALIFSGCRNCKNMSHFQNLKLHIHEFRLQILKKKKLSATILTLKPMCRLCTLYSPTKRILQMKSKLNLKSGKPVMWTSVWLHFYTQILEVDGCWKALSYIIRTQSWNQRNSWTTLE